MSDLERDGLQEVRGQDSKGLSVTPRAKISRRQFLTGAFRGRDAARSGIDGVSALPRNLALGQLAAHDRLGWNGDPETGRDFSAPEAAAQFQDWENEIDRVLEEMENLKGIEDF